MDAAWLFGGANSRSPSPDAEPVTGEALFPEQQPSILGQRAVITYFQDGTKAPVTTIESDAAPAASADIPHDTEGAYAISLKLDMTSGCGGTIWPAAEVLGAYIASMMTRTHTTPATHPWRGKSIVELGSGTGLVGFLVAEVGGEPIPSDIPPKPDVLLLADCVYREEAFQPLVDTMVALSTPHTEILFSYHKRRRADKRFFAMLKKHFTYTHVEDDDPARRQAYNRAGTSLMRIHLRA
ncbi:Protein-lysine N-methyltransferase efm6 [Malassezia brasiliensis]|uniref:Protein-lysine N-methyltransferase efm6 n=1 Tax=Malassezia brasiliensis TaxID=1821822 RepID=A0AAF0INJ9_9BASI|nr:Protein-lysine N-methyltransferase efm6 [Malassezia brasiliensis]